MSRSRREFMLGAVPAALAILACDRRSEADVGNEADADFPARVTSARARAIDFLLARQESDGAWRSDRYGTFKDGTALTPLALNALLVAAPNREGPLRRAADYLAAMARPDGAIAPPSYGFDFALYTAALTVVALSHPAAKARSSARDAWLAYLCQRQLTEELGWKPEDRAYGGWG